MKEIPSNISFAQIKEENIKSFHACLDSVAKEKEYLARLEAPPLEDTIAFVKKKIDKGIVHIVALDSNIVVGWCDIHP